MYYFNRVKLPLIVLLFYLTIGVENVKASGPRFYIVTETKSKLADAKTMLEVFCTDFQKDMKLFFPCAEIMDQESLSEMLRWERSRQLLGSGSQEELLNIVSALGSKYLVSFKVTVSGDQMYFKAVCLDSRNAKTLAHAEMMAPINQASSMVSNISKDLVKQLDKYEICHFVGPVNLVISSSRDTTEIDQYPVYCNGMDNTYRKVTQIENNKESIWNLRRIGNSWSEGTMTFSSSEKISVEESNGCYKCPSGREGGRIYHQKKSYQVKGNGISHESKYKDKLQQDTRVELEFLENGTYLIKPKGTSLPAVAIEKIEISAEGTCDNVSPESKTMNNEVTIPLYVIFGPYPGKSTDKLLKQSDVIKTVNPVSGERSTITIDFELKHD
jgi:hypothetical protein